MGRKIMFNDINELQELATLKVIVQGQISTLRYSTTPANTNSSDTCEATPLLFDDRIEPVSDLFLKSVIRGVGHIMDSSFYRIFGQFSMNFSSGGFAFSRQPECFVDVPCGAGLELFRYMRLHKG